MSIRRRIRDYRSTVILAVVVGLSLASLASGTRAGFVQQGIRTIVTVSSRPFLKGLKRVKNGVDYVSGLIVAYDSQRREAEALRLQAATLVQQAAGRRELAEENARLRRMVDFVRAEPRLTFDPVEVIESFKGILKIDRGSVHGIEPSMCVVTENGVVGLITEVDRTTATVVTLHNVNCRIAAMIERNRVRGSVHGSGSDLSFQCTMEYIDMKDDVQEGDEVVTSPESVFPSGYPVFPSGFPVGRVVTVDRTGSLWKAAYVAPAVDPYRLDEVLVVRRAVSSVNELQGREETRETPLLAGAEAPDNRLLQERYAP